VRFVLVDRLVRVEGAQRLHAEKTFAPAEELFLDHFPGRPLVPGTLLTEAIAQAGGWLLVIASGFRVWPILALVERAKFRRPVRPGDLLELEVWREPTIASLLPGRTCRVHGTARLGGLVAAEASCIHQLLDPGEDGPLGAEQEARKVWMTSNYRRLTAGAAGFPPPPEKT
jgi:3-hydroxyacyl-[acyl-carrier-protein] dehydratase